MYYQDAIDLKEQMKNLIGTIDEKGFYIDDLVIVPKDQTLQQEFWRRYMLSMDAETAILPYTNVNLDVWAIDKYHLQEAGVLFFSSLSDGQDR